MDRTIAKQLILQNKLERQQREEELKLKTEIEQKLLERARTEEEQINKRRKEAQDKIQEKRRARLEKQKEERPNVEEGEEREYALRLQTEQEEKQRQEEKRRQQELEANLRVEAELAERNRVEKERLTQVRAQIGALHEDINAEKQSLEILKQEEINLKNDADKFMGNSKNDAEKMKMFVMAAMRKMEQDILSNNQDVDTSFVNEVTKFKGNEKEVLKQQKSVEEELKLKINRKLLKIQELKNSVYKLHCEL